MRSFNIEIFTTIFTKYLTLIDKINLKQFSKNAQITSTVSFIEIINVEYSDSNNKNKSLELIY